MICIRWNGGKWHNWIDQIPDSWALDQINAKDQYHFCSNGAQKIPCLCDVSFVNGSLLIDYAENHSDENNNHSIATGATKIEFGDSTRLTIKAVHWADGSRGRRFFEAAASYFSDEDYSSSEGGIELVRHVRRERDPYLRQLKVDKALELYGVVKCEACGFNFSETYGEIGKHYCEVHHLDGLKHGKRITRIEDLAILCSNCHRIIHRTKPMEDVSNFKLRIRR